MTVKEMGKAFQEQDRERVGKLPRRWRKSAASHQEPLAGWVSGHPERGNGYNSVPPTATPSLGTLALWDRHHGVPWAGLERAPPGEEDRGEDAKLVHAAVFIVARPRHDCRTTSQPDRTVLQRLSQGERWNFVVSGRKSRETQHPPELQDSLLRRGEPRSPSTTPHKT
ncbi:hypothetical protein HispidOSU_026682 [Sigmodon hispidus]